MSDRTAAVALRILAPRARLLGAGDEDALQNVNTSKLPNGSLCWAIDQDSFYVLDKASTAVANGVIIMVPVAGPGRWIALGASGAGGQIIVPNIAALALLPAPVDGETAYVLSVRSTFSFVTGSAVAVDGITVVADSGATGKWFRSPVPNLSWQYVSNWDINPATGNDENAGSTIGSALKSWAELQRRLSGQTLQQATTVSLHGDLAEYLKLQLSIAASSTNPFRLVIKSPSSAWTTLYDSATQSGGTHALTAVTPLDRALGVALSLTDANVSVDPATFVGHRIRLTTGANAGATAWVTKAVSLTEFRTTSFILQTDPATASFFPSTVSAAIGDEYVIEDVAGVKGLDLDVRRIDQQDAKASPDSVVVVVDSIDVQKGTSTLAEWRDGYVNVQVPNALTSVLQRSKIRAVSMNGLVLAVNGSLTVIPNNSSVSMFVQIIIAGGMIAETGLAVMLVGAPAGIAALFANDFVLQGVRITPTGPMRVTTGIGIFDAGNPAIDLGSSQPAAAITASGIIYGSGNAGVGIAVAAAHLLQYTTAGNKPTITGSVPGTNDATIGGVNFAWAAIPATDTAKMCGIVVN